MLMKKAKRFFLAFVMAFSAVIPTLTACGKTEPKQYAITLTANEGGTATASHQKAKSGEVITVTATPNADFAVKNISAAEAETSTPVELTAGENYTHTFTMPKAAVNVNVEFVELSAITRYSNYVSDNVVLHNVAIGDKFHVGSSQRIELKSEYDFYNDEFTLRVNNDFYPITLDENDEKIAYADVVVPQGGMELWFMYDSQTDSGYSIQFTETSDFKIIGITNGAKYDYINFQIEKVLGFKITSVYVKDADGNESTINPYNGRYFASLSSDSTLHVEGESAPVYNISYTGLENADLDASILPQQATEGDSVNMFFAAKPGYWFEGAVITGTDLEGAEATYIVQDAEYTFKGVPGESWSDPSSGIISNITVEISFKANLPINVEENEFVTDVKFYQDYDKAIPVTSYNPNETLYIVPTAAEGYAVSAINATSLAGDSVNVYNYDGFIIGSSNIPKDGLNISFEVVEAIKASAVAGENYTIDFGNGKDYGWYASGAEVSFTVKATEGYKIDSVTCSDDSIYLSEDYGGKYNEKSYYFTMPNEAVTISAQVSAVQFATINVSSLHEDVAEMSVSGSTSGIEWFVGSESDDNTKFHVGESITVYLRLNSNGYDYTITVSQGSEEPVDVTDYLYVGSGYINGSEITTITDANVNITVSATAKAAVNKTISLGNATIEALVNNNSCSDLASATLYSGDSVSFTITSTPAENSKYVVSVTDSDGNELDSYYSSSSEEHSFDVEGDFNLTIEEIVIEYASLTVYNNQTAGAYPNVNDSYYNSIYSSYSDGTSKTTQVEVGSSFSISYYSSGVVTVVTVGGVEVYRGNAGNDYYSYTVTSQDAIVITFEDLAKDGFEGDYSADNGAKLTLDGYGTGYIQYYMEDYESNNRINFSYTYANGTFTINSQSDWYGKATITAMSSTTDGFEFAMEVDGTAVTWSFVVPQASDETSTWKDSSGSVLTFNGDGKGTYNNGSEYACTYSTLGDGSIFVEISSLGWEMTCTIDGDTLTASVFDTYEYYEWTQTFTKQ